MKLRIVEGKRRGKEFPIGREVVIIGRDPRCTIALTDDQVASAEHAELLLNPEGQLILRDLESVNGTEVNGQAVQESALKLGDRITIGNTIFEVVEEATSTRRPPPRESAPAKPEPPAGTRPPAEEEVEEEAGEPEAIEEEIVEGEEEVVEEEEAAEGELMFGHEEKKKVRKGKPKAPPILRRVISLTLTALITVVIVAGGIYILTQFQSSMPKSVIGGATDRLELYYEKVQASNKNIFRFAMQIAGGKVTLNVDDLKQKRQVQRDKKVGDRLIANLAGQIERAGFDKLDKPKYGGLPADVQESAVIELTNGARVKRVEVENTIAPEAFVAAQKFLEDFAQAELGLSAMNRSREDLIREADEAFLRGKTLYEQRDVDFPNLFNAIKAFQVVQYDLETIEPKPTNYVEAVRLADTARNLLAQRIDNLRFKADQAMRLSEWSKAAEALQLILRSITDREDDRYRDAERKLISVQQHLPKR
ncbi:MAG: FHA domain-containing protein [Verrucomicrobia bacterium]|nr:FHA domain-containing protein [Verrucomicrobiota bacterium]